MVPFWEESFHEDTAECHAWLYPDTKGVDIRHFHANQCLWGDAKKDNTVHFYYVVKPASPRRSSVSADKAGAKFFLFSRMPRIAEKNEILCQKVGKKWLLAGFTLRWPLVTYLYGLFYQDSLLKDHKDYYLFNLGFAI